MLRIFLVICLFMVSINLKCYASEGINHAGENPSSCDVHLKFPKGHPLRLEVERLEAGVKTDAAHLKQLKNEVKYIQTEYGRIRTEMTFREKYLWTWLAKLLGGNAKRIRNYRANNIRFQEVKAQLDAAKRQLSSSDQKVVYAIEGWLNENDATFLELQIEKIKFYDVVCAGHLCLSAIEKAIDDVDRAETEDLLAGVTDSLLLEVRAVSDTGTANNSVENAKAAVETYRQHIEALNHELSTHHGIIDSDPIQSVDPTLQLVVDVISGTGFMDLMNYFALSDVEDQLTELREKIISIHSKIERAHQQLADAITGTICQTREECLATIP